MAKCLLLTGALLVAFGGVVFTTSQQSSPAVPSQLATIQQYCVGCHNEKRASAGLIITVDVLVIYALTAHGREVANV